VTCDPAIWSKLHGASTHFPIALMLVSALCDWLSLAWKDEDQQRTLRSTATITITLGALGSYAAVATGLIVARGHLWGHGTLLRHHQFVWPAFVLMTGLATWRIFSRRTAGARPTAVYLVLMSIAAVLIAGAGYWGGEMLQRG
jgi:uncharacterized membrane protein